MALWGKTDTANDKPQYLSAADKAATVGVDTTEAQVELNINKGINTPGWVKYSTYTDANGATRHKSEVLVAFSSMTGDANDDSTVPDSDAGSIAIGTQPADATQTGPFDDPANAWEFSVTATGTNAGTLSYQWQYSTDSGSTWQDIPASGDHSDNAIASSTTANLTVVSGDGWASTDQVRVIVDGTNADPVTSDAADLL